MASSPASPVPKPSPNNWPPLWRAVLLQTGSLICLGGLLSYAVIALDLKWAPLGSIRELPVKEARSHPADFVWIDVRHPDRFASAHVPGAIHFDEANPKTSLEAIRHNWKAGGKLCVYGEGTGSERALRVARSLKSEFATREVYLLEGGWASWPLP